MTNESAFFIEPKIVFGEIQPLLENNFWKKTLSIPAAVKKRYHGKKAVPRNRNLN